MTAAARYDVILVLSFGGPEGPDDVLPFMENVTRGRGIPRERLEAVSGHYRLFGGVSPINGHNRALIAALEAELAAHGPHLPVYWGNRNWHPMLAETLETMRADGIRCALAFVTSAFSSQSGCRQYLDDIEQARVALGPAAPEVHKLRAFFNHPGFIAPMVDSVVSALGQLAAMGVEGPELAFCAHSIPMAMATTSPYVRQLEDAVRTVAAGVAQRIGRELPHRLVYQSRSGAPGQPWLEPDIGDHLAERKAAGAQGVVMVPIGFISDHMEVVYDLDTQAAAQAAELALPVVRAATVGTDPRFVTMVRLLVEERIDQASGGAPQRLAVGDLGPAHDVCAADCCPMPQRPTGRPA